MYSRRAAPDIAIPTTTPTTIVVFVNVGLRAVAADALIVDALLDSAMALVWHIQCDAIVYPCEVSNAEAILSNDIIIIIIIIIA